MAAEGMGPGPSEADLQRMLAEMREAPAEQVLVEVINLLLQAAQVKLGRPDARVLIDAVAAVAEASSGRADAALLGQVSQAVAQLRMAQVEAEGAEAGAAAPPGPATPPPPRTDEAARSPRSGPPQPPAGSRLWVPGR